MSTAEMSLSPETLAESDDERSQELAAIAYSFPEELEILSPCSAILTLPVSPLEPLAVSFPSPVTAPEGATRLHHLPSISIKFALPPAYPTESPPSIELGTTPPWLPPAKLAALQEGCLELWEGYQMVYAVYDYLQQCIDRGFDLDRPYQLPDALREPLLAFNAETKLTLFNKGTHDCGICLEPKKGELCHALWSCTHVFCRPCLQDYYSGSITEGEVSSVRCSDPSCVKNATRPRAPMPGPSEPSATYHSLPPTLPPEELEEIGIARGLVARYVVLKKKKALEKDPNTIYCPRQWCQAPSRDSLQKVERSMRATGNGYWLQDRRPATVPSPPPPEETHDEAAPKLEKLQICSVCSFAFCRVCRASWHGDFQICRAADGKLTDEEIANEKYIRDYTTPCPTCTAPCLKSHGCNHMICPCDTHFCFLCSAYLDAQNPYVHFNTRGTDCYQRLWEGEEGDLEHAREIAAQQADQPEPAAQDGGQQEERRIPPPDDGDELLIVFEEDTDSEAEFEVPLEEVPAVRAGRGRAARGGRAARRQAGRGGGRGGRGRAGGD